MATHFAIEDLTATDSAQIEEAAKLLHAAFSPLGVWTTMAEARQEVLDSLAADRVSRIARCNAGRKRPRPAGHLPRQAAAACRLTNTASDEHFSVARSAQPYRCAREDLVAAPHTSRNFYDEAAMAQATLQMQKKIISNQGTITGNQTKIIRNQLAILKNQKKIIKNQGKILRK